MHETTKRARLENDYPENVGFSTVGTLLDAHPHVERFLPRVSSPNRRNLVDRTCVSSKLLHDLLLASRQD